MQKNDKLKLARTKAKLSQQELGEKLGFGQAYVSKLEKGESFSIDQAKRIALILGVKWEDIMPDESNLNSNNNTNNNDTPLVESLRDLIKSKDETIRALKDQVEYLKDRLSQYENQPKTGTR